jgi:putative phosphoesterase
MENFSFLWYNKPEMNKIKIAVVSDSHDNTGNLEKVVNFANDNKCSHLFHLGDFVSPFTAQKLKAFNGLVKAVYGNCDGELLGLQRVITAMGGEIEKPPFKLELAGKKIFLMHEPFLLEELVKSQEADFIFYGHLHQMNVRKEGKTLVLNPGEAGGLIGKSTFFIVDPETGSFKKIPL